MQTYETLYCLTTFRTTCPIFSGNVPRMKNNYIIEAGHRNNHMENKRPRRIQIKETIFLKNEHKKLKNWVKSMIQINYIIQKDIPVSPEEEVHVGLGERVGEFGWKNSGSTLTVPSGLTQETDGDLEMQG